VVKQDTSATYHVSLRDLMSIKISDRREAVSALDATVDTDCPDAPTGTVALHASTLYRPTLVHRQPGPPVPPIYMKITVFVPLANIAAFVPQPFKERG